jgi:hypothetical protein
MQDRQIRAIAMAFAGAVVAAVAAMFIPVGILEGITGATGLSELIPATRAPLGDTARALIAFGAGALTLAVLAFVLLRQDEAPFARAAPVAPDWADDEAPTFSDRLSRIKLPAMTLPKMPWQTSDDDITDLSDLPKLRNGDSHPDAPPRRPLSAQQDLPVLAVAKVLEPAVPEPVVEPEAEPVEHAFVEPAEVAPPPVVAAAPQMTAEDVQPTLAEMVAQLETAVAERQKQLAELEAVAAQLGARPTADDVLSAQAEAAEPARAERPPLEAVPAVAKDDDVDSALAAALATLHRMNGTDR